MRQLILLLLTMMNIIFIVCTFVFHIGIDYLSLRIIFVAFSLVVGIYSVLLHETKQQLFLSLITAITALLHVVLIISLVYSVVYA
ncbi:hypothetical protein [Staphylococcus intermedius]|uniref:Uncharacterized protein n=1 Tax=Staphylococcus intermedius NCTC 11048 TaxID=1141106 RepID=A0A380G6C1_STAIN|nr:hypothetical protein [Staphylococcus intermedius]PCF63706.1 hypothetical protein B5C04_06930 [Staphylococcus intermedius]PCF78421.1 hypothetical protein B4W74_07280 [Staphylococcus intermedius]PCF79395.1 hypothetical protein B4W70_06920 [Staphylococcus intermedius]PCF86869.1 hypothetical protein B4W76_07385 [Staphylococcus intermedius]PNZ50663.1 hypothetical protein CD138_11170 [Staphylococcus intermedius NCTC 11048]